MKWGGWGFACSLNSASISADGTSGGISDLNLKIRSPVTFATDETQLEKRPGWVVYSWRRD
jgi:hypothetical protein